MPVANGDDGRIADAHDGIYARERFDLLRAPDGPAQGLDGPRSHQVSDAPSSIELGLSVGQHERHRRFANSTLLSSLIGVTRQVSAPPGIRLVVEVLWVIGRSIRSMELTVARYE